MTSTPPPDGAAQDPREQFTRFYTEYQPQFVKFVHFHAPAADEESIVGNAFLEVYSRWERIDNPTAYMYGVLRKSLARHYEAAKNEASLLEQLTHSRSSQIDFDPLERKIVHDDVVAALQSLPPAMREVAIMKWILDKPTPLIADELGIARSTVTTHLTNAGRRLEELFDATATRRGTGKGER
ncbi:sigma-70 family RNA polymerase sigma factor [Streptomyces sp. NPDC002764]|uniref:RNA polymerase sigma factor n=1 Tax=unclassified Streptomyces TaxID=2593676 RepID=UPI00332B6D54